MATEINDRDTADLHDEVICTDPSGEALTEGARYRVEGVTFRYRDENGIGEYRIKDDNGRIWLLSQARFKKLN